MTSPSWHDHLCAMRTEPCLCGGVIYADTTEFSEVAVRLHNQSVAHQIWRAIRDGRLSAEGTTSIATDDLSRLSGDGASSPLLSVGYQERRTH